MSASQNIKFQTATSRFSETLSGRVGAYFVERNLSKHANAEMVGKTVFGFVLWGATYGYLITGRFSLLGDIAIFVLHGYAQLYIAYNVAHDANHGAYGKSKRLNRLMSYSFDLVGISSYMWRLLHNDAHHSFVNVRETDTTFISGQLFRFSTQDNRRTHHRYQHLYAPFFYSLVTLDWVLVKDYRWLYIGRRFGNRRVSRHAPGDVALLFAGKAFYYLYMLILPLMFMRAPWYAVLLGFMVMHMFLGLTISVTFQPNHFTEGSSFPAPDDRGCLPTDYVQHVFDTTLDYARGNRFAKWWMGGLNLHIIHHMFPGICHVHYPALTEIIIATAAEHGLVYREKKTIFEAFTAHLRWLKLLGREGAVHARG